MKVKQYDPNGKFLNIIENVTQMKHLDDGRTLVYYDKKCEHCGHSEKMIWQIPLDYQVTEVEE